MVIIPFSNKHNYHTDNVFISKNYILFGEKKMPNLHVREVSKIVRDYFDEIKKTKFIFDIRCINYDPQRNAWSVICAIANVFDELPIKYIVWVDDATGDIISVCEYKEELP